MPVSISSARLRQSPRLFFQKTHHNFATTKFVESIRVKKPYLFWSSSLLPITLAFSAGSLIVHSPPRQSFCDDSNLKSSTVIAHAGDENFRTVILFDPNQEEQRQEAERLNRFMEDTALSMEGSYPRLFEDIHNLDPNEYHRFLRDRDTDIALQLSIMLLPSSSATRIKSLLEEGG